MPDFDSAFPSGTVTFLFTDVEGSARLWDRHPDAMRQSIDRHLAILHEAVAAHNGVHFKTIGDAIQGAFPTAGDGLAAAVAAQQALIAESWPDPPGPLRVRMALHAGAATPVGGDYLAPSLNRVSRLLFVSHGGQILLTETIRRLLEGALLPGVTLRDLGAHRLRDLLEPERIWQVLAPGLLTEFPPLLTLEARPHNLPVPPTPLIGRESDVAAVLQAFREGTRLVSITGPGGTGKTRLALEAAAELMDDFTDGVWLLELAGLTDPQLLLPQIAATLGVRESGGQSIAQRLVAQFAGQRVLLVLDNLEQFRPQDTLSRVIADLLTASPGLTVLATSRAPLRLRFERELPLAPLAVPAGADVTVEALSASPSVRLFMERAQAVRPGFVLGPKNAAAIAALCRRLDGLPLALELAAARVRALSPADILARLGERLDLLADPRSDRPDRQRTMEAAVAWSYDLLDPAQQAAFRRLSVFAGGSTLEAAEAVLGTFSEPALNGLDTVTALVEQGLLRNEEQPDGTLRFHMLETVRVFSRERLREAGEEDLARQAHTDHFRALATSGSQMEEQAAAHGDETAWLDQVEIDLDNVRAALQWTASERSPEALLTLVLGCWEFWWPRGYWTEARTWLERALAAAADTPPAMRAKALRALGLIADAAGHRERALALFEESLQLSRAHDDRDGEWATLLDLSLHWASRDYGEAGRYAETALAVAREVANPTMIARSLNRLGNWRLNIEHPRDAFTVHQEALGILESLGDERGIAETLDLLGIASILGADSSRAAGWFDRAIALWRTLGDRRGLASSLAGRTMCAHTFHTETIAASSTAAEVLPFGEESLALSREIGWRAGESFALWAYRGLALSATGNFQIALPSAREGLNIALEIEHQQWIIGAHCTLGILHACLFDCDSARREFTEALTLAHDMGSLYWIRSASGWLAASNVRYGDFDAAGAIIDEHLHEETPLDTIACRLLWVAAAELALARADAERALAITDRLVASAPGSARRPIPRLEWLRGEALTALGRFAEAEQALATASDAAVWCGARPLLWRIHAAQARLHLARGHHDVAEQATKAAQAIVSELAASVPDEALRDIFLRHAMREPLSSGA